MGFGYAIAFTGHRPNKLGGYGANPVQLRVKNAIRAYLEKWRPDHVISGMALGVDQWAAAIALELEIPATVVYLCPGGHEITVRSHV